MPTTTQTPNYTKEDMRTLAAMSAPGSVTEVYLEELKYSPSKFKALLKKHNLKQELHYLFEYPHDDLGLLVNEDKVHGYLKFRLTIDK